MSGNSQWRHGWARARLHTIAVLSFHINMHIILSIPRITRRHQHSCASEISMQIKFIDSIENWNIPLNTEMICLKTWNTSDVLSCLWVAHICDLAEIDGRCKVHNVQCIRLTCSGSHVHCTHMGELPIHSPYTNRFYHVWMPELDPLLASPHPVPAIAHAIKHSASEIMH